MGELDPHYAPPVYVAPPPPPMKDRGGCLSLLLTLAAIGNVIWIVVFLYGATHLVPPSEVGPVAHGWRATSAKAMLFGALVAGLDIFFIMGIWGWKKWALYARLGAILLGILAALRVSPPFALSQILFAVVFVALVAPRWSQFE